MDALIYDSHSPSADWTMVFNTYSAKATGVFYCVENAGFHLCRQGYLVNRSGYHSYMLLVTVQGRGLISYKEHTASVGRGDIVFLDCVQPHSYEPESGESWEFFWIHFNGANAREFNQYLIRDELPILQRDEQDAEYFAKSIAKIIEMKKALTPNFDVDASLLISGMLHKLAQGSTPGSENTDSAIFLIVAMDFIHASYQRQSLSLSEIAASAHLSKYYFSKIFKIAAGVSPYEYLIQYRINKSKELLAVTSLSVRDIAKQVGFSNSTCFISDFKKREGQTPLKYRKSTVPLMS